MHMNIYILIYITARISRRLARIYVYTYTHTHMYICINVHVQFRRKSDLAEPNRLSHKFGRDHVARSSSGLPFAATRPGRGGEDRTGLGVIEDISGRNTKVLQHLLLRRGSTHLVEDVVVALARRLVNHTRLFKQVRLDLGTRNRSFPIKMHL